MPDVASTWGLLPQFLAVMAAGVLLVALAYRRGWEQSAGGHALYWAGELLIFLPATARMISRSRAVGRWERLGLLLGVTAALYAVKYLYSPLAFKFPDELQHWRSATDILTTHHLFTPNASLPISPRFPGLEELTTALSSLTGLSVVSAGLLVAGIARLLLMLGLFELFRRVAGPVRPGADCAGRQGSAAADSRHRAGAGRGVRRAALRDLDAFPVLRRHVHLPGAGDPAGSRRARAAGASPDRARRGRTAPGWASPSS